MKERIVRWENLIFKIQAEEFIDDGGTSIIGDIIKKYTKGFHYLGCIPNTNDFSALNTSLKPSNKTIEKSGLRELPDSLEIVKPLPNKLFISITRQELIDGIVDDIKNYFHSNDEQCALIILLDGVPGTGKSWLLRYAAEIAGLELYRPVGIIDKYVGETGQKIEEIFKFLQKNESNRVAILWDEIDEVGLSRGGGTDTGSRDARNIAGAMFRGIDETRFVLLCTTNTYEVLDKAFQSRIKSKRRTLKSLVESERYNYLKDRFISLNINISENRLKGLSLCSWHMGFRDLESIVLGIQRYKNNSNPIFYSWRKTVENENIIWGKPIDSELKKYFQGKIWDIWTTKSQNLIIISNKDNSAISCNINVNGFISKHKEFRTVTDVNASIYLEESDSLFLCTDYGIDVFRNAFNTNSKRKEIIKEYRWVRDVVEIDNSNLLFGDNDGYFYILNTKNLKIRKIFRDKDIKPYSLDLLGKFDDGLVFLIYDYRNKRLSVECLKYPFKKHQRKFSFERKDSEIGGFLNEQRPQIFNEDVNTKIIVLASENRVEIFRWTYSQNLDSINIISAIGVTTAAIDPVTGKVAVFYLDRIEIYHTYLDTSLIEPTIIKLNNNSSKVLCARFSAFGQVLVWGHENGTIASVKSAPKKIG